MRCHIVLVLLLAPLTLAAADPLELAFTDSLSLGEQRVTGFTWAGADTLAMLVTQVDSLAFGDSLQVFLVVGDTTGTVYWQEDFTGVLGRGLAWDGEFFWSTGEDTEGGALLYKIAADTVAVEEVYTAPGHRPHDLAWDGQWLWLTDRDSGRIERIDPETGELTRSVGAPGFSPGGLAWDGGAMWVADAGTGRLTRMRGGRLDRRREVAPTSWFLRGGHVWLAHDGRALWVLVEDERCLRRLEVVR